VTKANDKHTYYIHVHQFHCHRPIAKNKKVRYRWPTARRICVYMQWLGWPP